MAVGGVPVTPVDKQGKVLGGGLPTSTGPKSAADSMSVVPALNAPFTDVSVASLSAGQAAGTTAVITANAARRAIAITPAADGRLYIASSAGAGFYWPLYAGVTRMLSGADCPTNALFVTGQTAAAALPMAEA